MESPSTFTVRCEVCSAIGDSADGAGDWASTPGDRKRVASRTSRINLGENMSFVFRKVQDLENDFQFDRQTRITSAANATITKQVFQRPRAS